MLSLLARRLVTPGTPQLRVLSTSATDTEKRIVSKLTERFSPTELAVQDVSGVIASEAFEGLSTVKQHKLVTETLKQEIGDIHGLQIKTIPPS
ncbi:hypothetical protein ID866_1201 [Astraeus odoratus]|nr:hypothetical protein ID866_1201 [Astraeus odoratus]